MVAVVLGVSGGVLPGLMLGYGQDRDGRPGMARKLLLGHASRSEMRPGTAAWRQGPPPDAKLSVSSTDSTSTMSILVR